MNDKEKKAIELLKTEIELLRDGHNRKTTDEYSRLNYAEIFETILNLIENQNIELKNLNSDKEILTDIINKQIKEIDYKDYEMFNIINSDKGKLFEKNKELFEENKELKRQILSLTYTNSIKEK